MEKRHYTFRGADFLLESISDCVVRVTHVDQVGYVGMSVDWNPDKPYVWATGESQVETEGISALATFEYRTIEEALEPLCRLMLRAQRKRDAQRINPEERKAAGRRVMREFLAELLGGSPLGSEVRIEAEVGRSSGIQRGRLPLADRYVEVSLADLCKLADSVACHHARPRQRQVEAPADGDQQDSPRLSRSGFRMRRSWVVGATTIDVVCASNQAQSMAPRMTTADLCFYRSPKGACEPT